MRELTAHKINDCNTPVKIEVVDGPGSGGANHRYDISGFDPETNPSTSAGSYGKYSFARTVLLFQNGPIKEAGVNGITHEHLIAILIDRLEGFQRGEFKCRENALAITKLEEAMHWLNHRTALRMARGVEGTHTV